jgi:hypothetical protein
MSKRASIEWACAESNRSIEPYERSFPSTLREASGQVASVNKTEGRLLLSLDEASGRTG